MKSLDRKIGSVEERLGRLEALSQRLTTFSDYQSSADRKDIAERNLQLAIEACLDIGKIIISREGLSEPTDNKAIFRVLAEAGFISRRSLEIMIPMAGMRNILVHGYDKIDDALIYGVLKKRLSDFGRYLADIRRKYPGSAPRGQT